MDRSAALVVRIWMEDDEAFRARLTYAPLLGEAGLGDEVTVTVAATPGGVIDAVRAWLDEFVGGAGTTN